MKQVKINGIKQNCYRSDSLIVPTTIQNPNKTQEKYESLEKVMLPNGYVEGIVVKDYPINAESISSLADGADYRNDPMQAIASAPQRVNLGDVTEAQKFLDNPQNFARIFDTVKKRLLEYQAQQNAQSKGKETESLETPKEGEKE